MKEIKELVLTPEQIREGFASVRKSNEERMKAIRKALGERAFLLDVGSGWHPIIDPEIGCEVACEENNLMYEYFLLRNSDYSPESAERVIQKRQH